MNAAGGKARQFRWDQVIAIGLGRLRLSPRDFWAMTPRELAGVLRGLNVVSGTVAAPRRGTLEALMNRFPDGAERQDR
ncbi:rcc01693 family protein [Neoaquamicrobium sediminum]|uniref:Rcc01693 family protein n=1 Tax=Neoaquamicrobium sediminum TaxID=1849104 RepID=A0ABV3WS23_9HYPH